MTTAVSLFAGVGGFDLALERAGVKVVASVEWDKNAQNVLRKQFPNAQVFGDIQGVTGEQLTSNQDSLLPMESSPVDFLAKTFPLLESEQGWQDRVVDFSGKSAESLTKHERRLLSSKMCLVFFHQITEEIWPSSLKRWSSAGIASLGGCLMLNTSEFPKEGAESSLSDVLETKGDHLKKYSLSAEGRAGYLAKSNEQRKDILPVQLQDSFARK
jgi:tRNA G37 N-methylase Trm5